MRADYFTFANCGVLEPPFGASDASCCHIQDTGADRPWVQSCVVIPLILYASVVDQCPGALCGIIKVQTDAH